MSARAMTQPAISPDAPTAVARLAPMPLSASTHRITVAPASLRQFSSTGTPGRTTAMTCGMAERRLASAATATGVRPASGCNSLSEPKRLDAPAASRMPQMFAPIGHALKIPPSTRHFAVAGKGAKRAGKSRLNSEELHTRLRSRPWAVRWSAGFARRGAPPSSRPEWPPRFRAGCGCRF